MINFHEIPRSLVGNGLLIEADEICPICLEGINTKAIVGHAFKVHAMHRICIEPWLQQHADCPVCRIPVYRHIQLAGPFVQPRFAPSERAPIRASDRSYSCADFTHLYIGCGLILGGLITFVITAIASVAGIMPMEKIDENGRYSSPVANGFLVVGTPIAAWVITKYMLRSSR